MRVLSSVLILLFCNSALQAQELMLVDPPRSAHAVAAASRHAGAFKAAADAYAKSAIAAGNAYLANLDIAAKLAMRAGDADEVVRISEAKKAFSKMLPPPPDLPKDDKAIEALQRHEATIKRAAEVFVNSMAAADKSYLSDLDFALRQSARAMDADEAARISTAKALIVRLMPAKGVSAAVQCIAVSALIDGDSELHVAPRGLYWRHVSDQSAKPGLMSGRSEPTYINGTAWIPRWGQSSDQAVDQSASLLLPITDIHFTLQMVSIGTKLESSGVENRDAVNAEVRNGELVVSIPDSQPGARWYRFRLIRSRPEGNQ